LGLVFPLQCRNPRRRSSPRSMKVSDFRGLTHGQKRRYRLKKNVIRHDWLMGVSGKDLNMATSAH